MAQTAFREHAWGAMKNDISSSEDIRLLVDRFYEKVDRDELLAPIFNEVARVDWAHHLPVMYQFWETMLLGMNNFRGRPFPKHIVLPLEQEHFERWLTHFGATVDEHFFGPKAEEAKYRALSIGDTFAQRMGVLHNPVRLRDAVLPALRTA